ncbi:hypothetical protein V5799_027745 [Amblyomma americanum]|uniref:BPTI/Kunitz inhibitor domain-containing protein n=1 Tax=Amblyomma americanum TaxID=6943 RepID=A0AAQ4DEU8_AMBAM
MNFCKALFFFALVALGSAMMMSTRQDPRCRSNRPPLQNRSCRKSYVYVASKRKCAWTCGRGPFVSRQECYGTCRTSEVCNWPHAFETCNPFFMVHYFDKDSGRCLMDIGGCRYYGNNFPTAAECRTTCKAD